VALGQHADCLLDPNPGGQRMLKLRHRHGQPLCLLRLYFPCRNEPGSRRFPRMSSPEGGLLLVFRLGRGHARPG
jgi:hypothetical protein